MPREREMNKKERKTERKKRMKKVENEKLKIQANFSFQFIFVNDFFGTLTNFSLGMHFNVYNMIAICWIVLNRRRMGKEEKKRQTSRSGHYNNIPALCL